MQQVMEFARDEEDEEEGETEGGGWEEERIRRKQAKHRAIPSQCCWRGCNLTLRQVAIRACVRMRVCACVCVCSRAPASTPRAVSRTTVGVGEEGRGAMQTNG